MCAKDVDRLEGQEKSWVQGCLGLGDFNAGASSDPRSGREGFSDHTCRFLSPGRGQVDGSSGQV